MSIETKTVRSGVRAMARQVGVTPSHLSRVLSGERTPSARLQLALETRGVSLGRRARKRRAG
jgi:transcriptional regulator with XRE-family HTH domain